MDSQFQELTMTIGFCYVPLDGAPVMLELKLPESSKIEQALNYLPSQHLFQVREQLAISSAWSIFGKKKTSEYVLIDGDRLELCRPLIADPMSARRRRAKREHKSGKM